MTFSDTLKKNWFISLLVIIFIVSSLLVLSWIGFMTLSEEPFSTLSLYELNGSVVPQGNIIPLAEKDFSVFPKLAPVIRDKNQKPNAILDNGNRLYTIPLTNEEYNKFKNLYLPSGNAGVFEYFFEYKGKYYFYNSPGIH